MPLPYIWIRPDSYVSYDITPSVNPVTVIKVVSSQYSSFVHGKFKLYPHTIDDSLVKTQ